MMVDVSVSSPIFFGVGCGFSLGNADVCDDSLANNIGGICLEHANIFRTNRVLLIGGILQTFQRRHSVGADKRHFVAKAVEHRVLKTEEEHQMVGRGHVALSREK